MYFNRFIVAALYIANVLANPNAVSVWDGTDVAGNVVIGTGQTVLLRNRNIIRGQLVIESGGVLSVDPNSDVYLQFGNLEINGAFAIGTADNPYNKTATIALGCTTSPYPASDDRRHGINVRQGGKLLLFGRKGTSRPWTRLAATAPEESNCLTLADSTDDWVVGDTIIVTSTDFDPGLTERRTITRIRSTCIEIDSPLKYMHYGDFAQGIDERAEMNPGFGTAQIQGVEIKFFGQGDNIGRYPIHFHLAGNVAQTNSFVKGNAIHSSYMRAVTIHGTQGVAVDRNVAYNITGHAMFLEDGAEYNNTFRGNLVAWVRQKSKGAFRLGSDALQGLSAYWITNPDNVFEDNVAAGVEGSGFWLHTRAQAKTPSFKTGLYPNLKPFLSPLRRCNGNSAHSVWNGFRIDSVNFDGDDEPTSSNGNAFSATYEPTALTIISNFTVHHARQGGWFRIFEILLEGWNVGDCQEGVQWLTTGNTATMPINGTIRNSHFVGSSSNRGNQHTSEWQSINYVEARSESKMLLSDVIKMGITIYDGPHYIENCTFENYISYPCFNYFSTAIGARAFNTFMMATTTHSINNRFINTEYPMYIYDRVSDGGKTNLLLDTDGSISGTSNAVITPDWDFYYTSSCTRNSSYGLACPHRYNNIEVIQVDMDGANLQKYGELYVQRTSLERGATVAPGLSFQGQYIPSAGGYLYHPSLSVGAAYSLAFTTRTPPTIRINLVNAKLLDNHVISICYPRGSSITSVKDVKGVSLSRAKSLVDTSCVNCFFYDTAQDILILRLQQQTPRSNPNLPCPSTGCEGVIIQASFQGSTAVADCNTRSKSLWRIDDNWSQISFSNKESFDLNMPINSNWCLIGDPCLENIDVGNREIGILAYSDSPCSGIGCYSNNQCRYCKLSYSQSSLPFLPCPFETKRTDGSGFVSFTPNPVTATPVDSSGCSAFVSVGDATAGISAMGDASCAGASNSSGCFQSKCRFCMARSTPQSRNYLPCKPPSTDGCAALVSSGDQERGLSAVSDPNCPVTILAGCFGNKCRFCQEKPTEYSWRYAPCDQAVPASPSSTSQATTPLPITTTPIPTTTKQTSSPSTTAPLTTSTSSPSPAPAKTSYSGCTVPPGDYNIGLDLVYDERCPKAGLGCREDKCRFCQRVPTSTPATYLPCDSLFDNAVASSTSQEFEEKSSSDLSLQNVGIWMIAGGALAAIIVLAVVTRRYIAAVTPVESKEKSILTIDPTDVAVVEIEPQEASIL